MAPLSCFEPIRPLSGLNGVRSALLIVALLLGTDPAAAAQPVPIESESLLEVLFRGQSPGPELGVGEQTPSTQVSPGTPPVLQTASPAAPSPFDRFVAQPPVANPAEPML